MTTFLVVEDEWQTRELLLDLVGDEFPAARVDEADNLADAIQLARETQARGEPYDVALLDVNLPIDGDAAGDNRVHPEARRELLRVLREPTKVVNYSTTASDARLRQEIDRLHEPNTPVPILIDASPGRRDWPDEILQLCRRVVYGRRIAEQLDRMLRADRTESAGIAARSARVAGESTGTQALGDLMRDITLHWGDLDEELRRRIRGVFEITEADGEVLVNL